MEINKARNLQKMLAKSSQLKPVIGSCFNHCDGKFCYYVSHLLSDGTTLNFAELGEDLLDAINKRRDTFDLKYTITTNFPTQRTIRFISRFGIMLIEIIEVD